MKTASMIIGAALGAVTVLAGSAAAREVTVTFHFMQIEQAIGGVNGDTTAQAVQLRMRSGLQNNVSESRLRVWDKNGQNPILLLDIAGDVPNGALGDRVLIVTESFKAKTNPACVPDFVMTTPIPAEYLAAGRLTFEDDFGGIVWSLAWGGAAYTGPNDGSIFNDDNGNYGPPWDGPLPSSSGQALQFQGTANQQSKSNSTDYKLTTGDSVWTNNAKQSFTVAPPPCYADCDGSGELDIDDFICYQTLFGLGSDAADCDGSGEIDIDDFICFQTSFGVGC